MPKKFRVTAENMVALKELIENLTSAWEDIENDVETWTEGVESRKNGESLDADQREELRDARTNIDDNLDAVLDAIRELASTIGVN